MVCYKETLANAKIDPSPEWTGTWRTAVLPSEQWRCTGDALTRNVLQGDQSSRLRRFRNSPFRLSTIVADLEEHRHRLARGRADGDVVAGDSRLRVDTDVDNGVRPAGLIRLSETTNVAAQVLQDAGATYVEAPLTHYLTMYRAPERAKVFGTGTVQWAWGLDDYHHESAGRAVPTDVRMQQATLNVLADMGVQPADLSARPDRRHRIDRSDRTHLDDHITSQRCKRGRWHPRHDQRHGSRQWRWRRRRVEVSIDDGVTWHPATGTSAWSYVFTP